MLMFFSFSIRLWLILRFRYRFTQDDMLFSFSILNSQFSIAALAASAYCPDQRNLRPCRADPGVAAALLAVQVPLSVCFECGVVFAVLRNQVAHAQRIFHPPSLVFADRVGIPSAQACGDEKFTLIAFGIPLHVVVSAAGVEACKPPCQPGTAVALAEPVASFEVAAEHLEAVLLLLHQPPREDSFARYRPVFPDGNLNFEVERRNRIEEQIGL